MDSSRGAEGAVRASSSVAAPTVRVNAATRHAMRLPAPGQAVESPARPGSRLLALDFGGWDRLARCTEPHGLLISDPVAASSPPRFPVALPSIAGKARLLRGHRPDPGIPRPAGRRFLAPV